MEVKNEEAKNLLEKLHLNEFPQDASDSIESEPKVESVVRHCAACLQICEPPVKKCGGCKKRAYCSKKCQIADWKVNGTGQGHKNWCGRYECGEEDIDWEVVPVLNKGLGVKAKKLIPVEYKIIVEPVYTDPHDHPGINDLEPKGASLEAKFQLNCVAGDEDRDGGKAIVGLRISRVNHDCRPNAARIYDDGARVDILFALREIFPGEEICVTYCSFARLDTSRPTAGLKPPETEFSIYPISLKMSWNIVCSGNCYCKDPNARKLVMEGRRFNDDIQVHADRGNTEAAIMVGEKLLDIHRELNLSWTQRASINFDLFQISLMKKKTLSRANRYIRATLQIYRAICPYSKHTKMYEMLCKHPEMDDNYLMLDAVRSNSFSKLNKKMMSDPNVFWK